MRPYLLISGNSNRDFSLKISQGLKSPLGDVLISHFEDGESRVEICEDLGGKDIFIVQSTSHPANHNIIETTLIADACRRAAAHSISLIIPYFGYARQERRSSKRSPISGRLMAEFFECSGIGHFITMELHNEAIEGFFTNPLENLSPQEAFFRYFHAKYLENLVVVSPDSGGVERAAALAKKLDCGLVIVDKRREKPNSCSVFHIIGDIADKNCLIVDDIIDTGNSLIHAAEALTEKGARSVFAAITHAVMSSDCVQKIGRSSIHELVVTDTIQLSQEARECSKITEVSVADIFIDGISQILIKKNP